MKDFSVAVLMLHQGCNMSCSFCVNEESLSSMNFLQAVKILHYLKGHSVSNLVLGGGEPFTWNEDVIRLTEVAQELGFFVQVGTNGVHLPENFEEIPSINRYVLPLESSMAATHNRMRFFHKRHHQIILNRLERLIGSNKSVTISTVVTQDNIYDLPDLADRLAAYANGGGKVHAWHLYRFIPEGRGGRRNATRLQVPTEDYRSATSAIKDRGLPFQVFRRLHMYQSKTVEFFWYENGRFQTTHQPYPSQVHEIMAFFI
jgi:MoaA/NifB/PqqE/SkfB family radical SAM enzyme